MFKNAYGYSRNRLCNTEGCQGILQSTNELWDCDGKINSGELTWYECPVCHSRSVWIAKPILDGTAAELHKVKHGYSVISMNSDPRWSTERKPAKKPLAKQQLPLFE